MLFLRGVFFVSDSLLGLDETCLFASFSESENLQLIINIKHTVKVSVFMILPSTKLYKI